MKVGFCTVWIAYVAALFCPCTLQGQEGPVHTDTLSLRVYFRRGEHVIRPEYMANGERLRAFSEAINSHGGGQVRSVTISAGASPDGNTRKNQELSAARAQSLRVFFHTAFPQDSFSATTTVNALGEDWDGLLESLAALDEPWRDRAVDIIRHTPVRVRDDRGKIVAGRKRQLEVLNGGKAWRYMEEHVFQDLRCASGLITCVFSGATPPCSVTANLPQVSGEDLHVVPRDTVVARDTVYIVQRDTVWRDARSVPDTTQKKERTGKVVLAFRTNVLAVPLANVGLEVPLGNHWSLAADWYYPWIWRPGQKAGVDTNGWCFQFLAAGAEARYWFGSAKRRTPNRRLTGHSVGVYGAVGYYDFENNFKGHQGRGNWWSGVSKTVYDPCPAGYRMPSYQELMADEAMLSGLLPCGRRNSLEGQLVNVGKYVYYWSSTAVDESSVKIYTDDPEMAGGLGRRSRGLTVRPYRK